MKIPHKCNAAGDFYVEAACCTSCALPFSVAPDLFAWADDGSCFVKTQPTIDADVDKMVQAASMAELVCIRYKGTNRAIQLKLIAAGEADQCDVLPPDLEPTRAVSRSNQTR
jgi:ferredoxin